MRNHSLSLRHFIVHTLLCSAALAALLPGAEPAAAQEPYRGCSVPEAEAEVCPSFTIAPEGVAWWAVSGDGSTLVGTILIDPVPYGGSWAPARWIDGMQELLGPVGEPGYTAGASSVSADGSVIVGKLNGSIFRWESGAYEVLAPRDFPAMAADVSADGSVVVGYQWSGDRPRYFGGALAWDDNGVRVVEAGVDTAALAVSADGSAIAGPSGELGTYLPVIWESGMRVDLPLGPGNTSGVAEDITPDGSIVVGYVYGDEVKQGARWVDHTLQILGVEYPGGAFAGTYAVSVSADGSLVLGVGVSDLGIHYTWEPEPFVWDAEYGLRKLAAVLSDDLGIDLVNLNLDLFWGPGAISDDGRFVVGTGRGEGDALFESGWTYLADLSPPVGTDIVPSHAGNVIELTRDRFVSVRIFGTELLDVDDIDVDALAFGPHEAPVENVFQPSDANDDGYLDLEVRFETGETGIAAGDTESCLSGRAMGLPFEVCGPIEATLFGFGPGAEIPGCGRGFEGALALPALLWVCRRGRGACPGRTWR